MDMNRNGTHAIGLMSGTSLDGIDLVYVYFPSQREDEFEIIASQTIDYSPEWKLKLKTAIDLNEKALIELDAAYGRFLGEQINKFIHQHEIQTIDFIASHGHTIFHQPEKGITKQIGNGQYIADATNFLVVCDFRTQDVQLGGQGAPLVPIGDRILFSNYDACVNLGGFANISYEQGSNRIAFDICPVNVVLNHYSQKLGYEYDNGGILASQGKVNTKILSELNSMAYYEKSPPKSLGIEWVNDKIFPVVETLKDHRDVLRTFVEHVTVQIANSIGQFQKVLFTGGGVFNEFLIENLKRKVNAEIAIPSKTIVDYKEALIFALLGKLRLEEKSNCLSSVTGAKRDHSSGQIFRPN
ncbi:anhydro-N-acetylmuramic acid kinase [Pseudotenacibaculum haliotis]|uniref:Anhydro-N-acetylmuramic acid kinase n=1 Tax=Pseudotenacibaculum haliotis TaxID=1862138 RepID=A0ABW5LTB7_9FLAO